VAIRRGQIMDPIIATIIVIAITLVIAVTVIGWMLGFWGSIATESPQIAVGNPVLCAGHGNITAAIYVENSGDAVDRVVAVYLSYAGNTYEGDIVTNTINASAGEGNIIPAKSAGWLYMKFCVCDKTIRTGDSATIRIEFEKSETKTVTVRALECEVLQG